MQAKDLAERVPVVHRETTALEAAQIIAALRLGGVVVADGAGEPVAVVPVTQVLRLVVPSYVQEDPALAHVYDEAAADEMCARLQGRTVADLLDDDAVRTPPVPQVRPDDTLLEIAAVMVRENAPVVVVREPGARSLGVVTLPRLLAAVLSAAGRADPAVAQALADDLAELLRQHGEGPVA